MNETIEPLREAAKETPVGPEPKLRLWPALVCILIGFGISMGIAQFGSTNEHNIIGFLMAPVVSSALIMLWWLFLSRVRWRDRLIGLAALGIMMLILYLGQKENAIFLIAVAIPYFTYGVVLVLTLLRGRAWKVQQGCALLYCVLCLCVFSAMRVDSIRGDLSVEANWRWKPPAEVVASDNLSIAPPSEVAILPEELNENDWPVFRGIHQDSHLPNVTFPTDWTTPPREVWRQRIGGGWSSFTVVGDYFFTQEQRGEHEVVVCYIAATGEVVWVNSLKAHFDMVVGPGPRATPTYSKGKLYVQGAMGALQCLDAKTGTVEWGRDLGADTEVDVPQFGFSSSPLVLGDMVIQFSGPGGSASMIAYHRSTGEVQWKAGKDGKEGYSSPHFAELEGIPQVLINTNFGLQSFAPETGKVLWDHEWIVKGNPRVVQPLLVDDGGILIGTAAGMGTRRLDISREEDTWKVDEQWTTKRYRPYFNDQVFYEGYAYGFDGNRLMCIDVKTGERQWRGDRVGGQLLFVRDMKMLLVLTEKGEVLLVNVDPENYTVVSRFQAITGKTWNHPVIAHGNLYVRNAEEMACFELMPAA